MKSTSVKELQRFMPVPAKWLNADGSYSDHAKMIEYIRGDYVLLKEVKAINSIFQQREDALIAEIKGLIIGMRMMAGISEGQATIDLLAHLKKLEDKYAEPEVCHNTVCDSSCSFPSCMGKAP